MPSTRQVAAGGTVVRPTRGSNLGEQPPSDADLLARVAEGSSEAFAELYERYFQQLYDFAARITRDRAAAADVVQTTFTAVWERTQRGEQLRSPRAWLYRVTYNAAIDELRRRRWTVGTNGEADFDFAALEDVHVHEPAGVLIDKELAELVWETAATMDPKDYGLLDMHVRRGLEPEELAGELKVSTGAVYTRLSRLRRSFEDALAATLLTRRAGRDCSELAQLVTTLGDEAGSVAGRRSIRTHVRTCPVCQAARRRHVTAAEILASLGPVPLTPGIQGAVWAKLMALLGLSAAGGAATATAGGPVDGAARAVRSAARSRRTLAAGAAIAVAVIAAATLGVHFALAPSSPGRAARDPAHVWSPSNTVGRSSTRNRIAIAWSQQPSASGFSVLWSHGPRDEPDAVAELPGTATQTTSPSLTPGRWYFHLRTRGRDGSWTDTVHLGPFVVLALAPGSAGMTGEGRAKEGGAKAGTAGTQPPAAGGEQSSGGGSGQSSAAGSGQSPGGGSERPPSVDQTAPSGQAVELVGGPYFRRPTVPLALHPGTDGGSGVDPASGVLQRQSAALADAECGSWGGWQRVVLRTSVDTTVADGRCYRYRYRISDLAGNVSRFSAASDVAKVDTTPPTAPRVALAAGGPDAAATGTTLFYRPAGAGGTFTVTASSADAGSGLAVVAFPRIGAGMSATAATRQVVRPYELTYTWVAGADAAGVETVTAIDRAGNSSSSTFLVDPDSAGPEDMSASVVGGPWFTAASVPLHVSEGSDSGAGLAPESATVERDQAPLMGGACGSFAGAWSPVTLRNGSDADVSSGRCYRYRVSVSDRVGNRSSSPASDDARIDTSPPSLGPLVLTPSPSVHVSGSTVYDRPGAAGSFAVTAPATDPESGIDHVSFPSLPAASGGGSDDSPPYETSYVWNDGPASAGTQTVTASNRAGLLATSDFSLVPDADPPTGMHVALVGGPRFTSSVTLSVDPGVDSGSGVDPASLQVERDAAPLAPDGACGAFTGAWTPVTLDGQTDTGVASGSCYRYRVAVDDFVGNQAMSPPSATAIVAPPPIATFALSLRATSPTTYASGTTLFYRADVPGSFTAEASIGSGATVDSVAFPLLVGAEGGGVDASAPFAAAYSWTALAVAGPQPVTASNGGGGSARAEFTVQPDDEPPSGMQATVTGRWFAGPVPVAVDVGSDAGSGVDQASLRIGRDAAPLAPDGTCGTFADNWTSVRLDAGADTAVADGTCYRYRADIADKLGNRAFSPPSATAIVDTAPPTGVSVVLVGGTNHVGAVPLRVEWGTDAGSGIDEASELVERDAAPLAADGTCGSFPGAWTPVEFNGSSTVDTGVARDTCYRYRALDSDRAGNRATSPPSDVATVH